MNKSFRLLWCALLLMATTAFGQTSYSEAEPNNSFATAGNMPNRDTLNAAVGGADAIDYFKPDVAFWSQYGYSTGSLMVSVTATNSGASAARLRLNVFNGLQAAGAMANDSTASIAPGATVTTTFRYCGLYMDDYYLAFSSTGTIAYRVFWYFSDPNPNTESNNSRAAATTYSFDTLNTLRQAVNYQYRQNAATDPEDWFRTTLPPGNYADIALEIKAKNNSCAAGRGIQYALYRNSEATPFSTGYIGNNPAVAQFAEVFSRIPLSGMQPGDALFIRLWANAAFGYTLKYGGTDADFEEEASDIDYEGYAAEAISENETKVAQVGYHVQEAGNPVYDDEGNAVIDNADAYLFTLPQEGDVTFYIKARNDGCGEGLYFDLLDQFGSSLPFLSNQQLVSWDGNCNETLYAVKFYRAFLRGTYQLRIHNGNSGVDEKVSYTLRYQFQPYGEGGNDEEFNNTQASARPIAEGETKQGTLRFISTSFDNIDHYRTTLNVQSSIRVYIRARYRGHGAEPGNTTANRLTFNFITTNFTKAIPVAATPAALPPDGVYLDTLDFPVAPMGLVRFSFAANEPWQYEFRYEITDSVAGPDDVEPNNTEAEAISIGEKEVKKGRVSYGVAAPYDTEDYYKATLPRAATINVIVKAINRGATVSNNTNNRLRLLVSGSATTYSLPANPPSQIVTNTPHTQTFRLCGVGAGPLFFRVQSSSGSGTTFNQRPYDYEISYEMEPVVDTTFDREPDNDYAGAKLIATGQTHRGLLGRIHNNEMDMNDYYKLVMTHPDSLQINFGGTSFGCLDNKYLRLYVYNTRKQFITSTGFILNAVGTVDAGQTVSRSIKLHMPLGDSVFLRMNADGLFDYWISTGQLAPASLFTITGDTTACAGPEYVYSVANVPDSNVTYHWSLPLGGGILTANGATSRVTWTESAPKQIALYLSNAQGVSKTKTQTVIVSGTLPTATPVAFGFARRLSTSHVPPGAWSQWYRNDTAIGGAIDSAYYAADGGRYTVRFVNDCGAGPVSNSITYNNAAQPQTINYTKIGTVAMAPNLRLPLAGSTSSGLPVLYQFLSGKGSIVNDSLRITGTGQIILRAYQPGDDVYSPATDVRDTITVVKGQQVILFDSLPDRFFVPSGSFPLVANSSSGLGVGFRIVSGQGRIVGSQFRFTGAGTVTVSAEQGGNNDYHAATPVVRTFCIGVREISAITGDAAPCTARYTYTTQKIPGAVYHWTLSGGGVLTAKDDTAFVQWQTPGTHTLRVKVNTTCDAAFSNEMSFDVTLSSEDPEPVSGMKPVNGARDQQLPLTLSWIPGARSVTYDVYVWDSAASRPAMPFAANLKTVSTELPLKSFAYNTTYKWQVISRNPCGQTAGPVQRFRLIPLSDLVVTNVAAPTVANSGQTITINWTVKNIGPGRTLTTERWKDGVFFALDTMPNFRSGIDWNPSQWLNLTADRRPLLLGSKSAPASLDSGESYTNSLTYTLPKDFVQKAYVYVIANYPSGGQSPLQVSVLNDTLRAKNPVDIQLSPTPDLRIDTVTSPTSAFSGSTINLAYVVRNYGTNTEAKPTWRDSVFISQHPFFVRELAVPLNYPKADGSYYPNAFSAAPLDTTQLLAGASRTRSIPVVIPNYIFGTWFIYVKANADDDLYEGAANGNNVNRSQIEIYLTPTPKLIVSTLNVPVNSASTTQPFGVNWNIHNDGFRDNIEKNRGHYLWYTTCSSGGSSSGRLVSGRTQRNVTKVEKPVFSAILRDSVVFGSSYWLDRVYLSKDASGLNPATAIQVAEISHGKKNSGIYPDLTWCPANVSGNVNVDNTINPGSNFPKNAAFNIPSDLQPGNYYVYVVTNATKTVYEYPGNLQVRRSDAPVSIQRPDLSVPSVVVPAAVSGGQRFNIQYTVQNSGSGSVFNHRRTDRIYSSIWPVFDNNAVLIDTVSYTEDIPAGGQVTHTRTYTFPAPTSGARYFYVQTNQDSAFRETNMANNLSTGAQTMVSAAVATDLVVSSVELADSVFTIFTSHIRYTVTNNGTGTTLGRWTDSLFLSCSPIFNPATAQFVGARSQQRSVAKGESYTDTVTLKMPYSYEISLCFPEANFATGYFFVKTNADTATYEGTSVNNNIGASGAKIVVNPLVDHMVKDVRLTGTPSVGRNFTASYTVKNIGYNPNIYAQYGWFWDAIYLSPDSVLNNNDVQLLHYGIYRTINRHDSLRINRSVTVPNVPAGDYYLLVHTNYNDVIRAEKNKDNNVNLLRDENGVARKFRVERNPLPDLVDSIITAPAEIALGQPFTVVRRITNKGDGVTYPTNWAASLLLSTDFAVANNDGDRLLDYQSITKVLQPGESILDTAYATIPLFKEPGQYVLISHSNSSGAIVESNSTNNLGFSLVNVYEPPATDLTVASVTAPDTVLLGYTIDTVKWVVNNQSAQNANGISRDGLYLSANTNLDSTAVLIGIKEKTLAMDPLDRDTLTAQPLVTGVVEGLYNLLVRTDLQSNIVESDKDNNTGVSAKPVYVKVKELRIGVTESNTLHRTGRYYKLLIPDSLIGSTIRVVLKTGDSLSVRNELFIGGGYVPSPARFDYRFETPNAGNQQVVMASITEPVYYIYVQSATKTTHPQAITLRAEVLPFTILHVQSPSGGNSGNVTVKLSGSLFTEGMTASLKKGDTVITASQVYFTNSTLAYATFNLRGKALGVYDVRLKKGDTATAVLERGFSIVPTNNGGLLTGSGPNTGGSGSGNEPGCDPGAPSGLNSQLVVEMVIPPRVLLGRPVLIQINYHNPTNVDIPAQTRVLYIEDGMKLALRPEDVPNGTDAMYLELTEPGGPPGIIRAGGSGTITLYTKAPTRMPLDPQVFLKLK